MGQQFLLFLGALLPVLTGCSASITAVEPLPGQTSPGSRITAEADVKFSGARIVNVTAQFSDCAYDDETTVPAQSANVRALVSNSGFRRMVADLNASFALHDRITVDWTLVYELRSAFGGWQSPNTKTNQTSFFVGSPPTPQVVFPSGQTVIGQSIQGHVEIPVARSIDTNIDLEVGRPGRVQASLSVSRVVIPAGQTESGAFQVMTATVGPTGPSVPGPGGGGRVAVPPRAQVVVVARAIICGADLAGTGTFYVTD